MKYYLTLGLFAIMSALSAQTDAEKAAETVDKNNIEGHIYFLADDLLRGRATGSPELKIAASYLANTLRGYGVKPSPKTGNYYQQVELKQVSPPSKVDIQVNGTKLNDYAIITPSPISANGDALFLNYGLESDYKGKDVKGKIILLKAGGPDTKDARAAFGLASKKQQLAKANGVSAIIELLDTDDYSLKLTSQHFFDNWRFSLSAERLVEDGQVDSNSRTIDSLSLNSFWLLNQQWLTAIDLSFQQHEYEGTHPYYLEEREDDVWLFSSFVQYNLSKTFSYRLNINVQDKNSNLDLFSYNRSEISLSASMNF